jgi:FAD dependent oxidoreductase
MAQRGSAGGVSRRHVLKSIGAAGMGSLARAAAVNVLTPLVLRDDLVFGLCAAYYLTQALLGKRIALLEARSCGNGASGRNGAMMLNLKRSSADPGIDRRLYDLTVENIKRLFSLSRWHGTAS